MNIKCIWLSTMIVFQTFQLISQQSGGTDFSFGVSDGVGSFNLNPEARLPLASQEATYSFQQAIKMIGSKGDNIDYPSVFNHFLKSAQKGHVTAQYNVGMMYLNGKGTLANPLEAFYWFEKCAHAGEPWGQFMLGFLYSSGIGTPKDEKKAVLWYEKSAQKGVTNAMVNLGNFHLQNHEAPDHLEQAFKYYLSAANTGDNHAQLAVGLMYYNGEGVIKNRSIGIEWIRNSMKQGNQAALKFWNDHEPIDQ